MCQFHADLNRDRCKVKYQREKETLAKARRLAAIESRGKCSKKNCARPAAPGKRQCKECARYTRVWYKNARNGQIARGLCAKVHCTKPPHPGRKQCWECLRANSRMVAKSKRKRRRELEAAEGNNLQEITGIK